MRLDYDSSIITVEHEGGLAKLHPREILYAKGPVIPVYIEIPKYLSEDLLKEGIRVEPIFCHGLIDTGANFCIVRPKIISSLGLKPKGKKEVFGITGSKECPIFSGAIRTELGIVYEIPIIACDLGEQHFDCIIGRNITRHWDFHYSGVNGIFSIDDFDEPPKRSFFDDIDSLKNIFNPSNGN